MNIFSSRLRAIFEQTVREYFLVVVLVLLGGIAAAGYGYLSHLGDLRPQIDRFLLIVGGLFFAYAIAIFLVSRVAKPRQTTPGNSLSAVALAGPATVTIHLGVIIGFAILFRLLLLFDNPWLSDDIYRYMWDGRVWSHGINPYRYAPADSELADWYDTVIHPKVNHPQIPTIYPPLLQLIFRLTYLVSPTVVAYKTVFVLFDLATLFALLRLLLLFGMDKRHLLIYAWNPLVIIETAGSGHSEVIGVFLLVLTFISIKKQRLLSGAFALAGAILTKFVPLLLLPFVLLHTSAQSAKKFAAIVMSTIVIAYLPFLGAGANLFRAATVYTTKWNFNASLFQLVYEPIKSGLPQWFVEQAIERQHFAVDAESLASVRIDLALFYTKTIFAIAFGAFFLWLLKNRRNRQPQSPMALMTGWFYLFGALSVVSPTLHPWYLIWLLPVLTVRPNRAWLMLTGLIMLSYTILRNYYLHGVWAEQLSTKLAIFLPFYALLLYDSFAQRKKTMSSEGKRVAGVGM